MDGKPGVEGHSPRCFVCGSSNPWGLGLEFENTGKNRCEAEFTPNAFHVSWPGICHGAIIFGLIDGAVSNLAARNGIAGMTRRVEMKSIIDFENLLLIGESVVVKARLRRTKNMSSKDLGRYTWAEGRAIVLRGKDTIATAEIKFISQPIRKVRASPELVEV